MGLPSREATRLRVSSSPIHSKLSSGYGHHARSHGTRREFESPRVRLDIHMVGYLGVLLVRCWLWWCAQASQSMCESQDYATALY